MGHHHGDEQPVDVAILTVSTSRDATSDESGPAARAAIEASDHRVVATTTVTDDEMAIGDAVEDAVESAGAEAVVTLGGTGITPDDVTVEALRPLFDRELPGVGEHFRRLSHEQVGTRAMLSRATAGVVDGGPVIYALPGNPNAVELGVKEVVLPELGHAVTLASRS